MMASLLLSTFNTRPVLPDSLRYLRSDVPLSPCPQDIDFLLSHGIRLLIDLRSDAEREKRPCPLAQHPDFIYRPMPVTGGNAMPASVEDVTPSYIRMADEQMHRILQTMLHSDSGVMFFCAAGKDRTGVVSAILQHLAGMPRAAIIADYVQSGQNLQEQLRLFGERRPEIDPAIYTPQPGYMAGFLDWLEKHMKGAV